MERLQKLLAKAGVASRRAAEQLIVDGRVEVNGRVVTTLGSRADATRDEIRVDGSKIRPERRVYVLLHKPARVVSTLDDPEGRATVRDLLPAGIGRVYPIGRLDYATSGALLMSNDGDLAARLLHPSRRVSRAYRAKVFGRPAAEVLRRLRRGVELDGGMTGAARVEIESELPTKTWLTIVIREGRYREVRRMCEAVGHRVDRLERVRFGPIGLGDLERGAWRELTKDEVAKLERAAGTSKRPSRRRKKAT